MDIERQTILGDIGIGRNIYFHSTGPYVNLGVTGLLYGEPGQGLRYHNGRVQFKHLNGTWMDIGVSSGVTSIQGATGVSGTGSTGLQGVTGPGGGSGASSLDSIIVGVPPSDNDYTDGLFQWGSNYNAADALDEVNEFLLNLAPPAPPGLNAISANNGVNGKLSFDGINTISSYTEHPTLGINDPFTVSGSNKGIVSGATDITGVLASDVSAHDYSYPANAFKDGNLGTLSLEVNGSIVHSTDLSAFGSGSSVNGNGSGFNLSAASPLEFQSGATFDSIQYRTGTYSVDSSDLRAGYNYIQIKHSIGSRETNTWNYIVDIDTTSTTFSGQSFSNLSLTGSKWLSGVNYNTGGSVDYNLIISNLHRDTYSSASNAINHTGIRLSLADSALGDISNYTDDEVLSGLQATINSSIIISGENGVSTGQSIGMITSVDRTVQSDLSSSTLYGYDFLLDNSSSTTSETYIESFRDETYRIKSSADFSSSSGIRSGTKLWTDSSGSQNSLVGSTTGYSNGLQVFNGTLIYPVEDFRNSSDGGSRFDDGPTGNPNYTTASGDRVYIRYFYNGSATYQNFVMALTSISTTFVSIGTSLSSNNCHMELCAPGETSDGSTFEWKDCVTPYTTDDDLGCYAATFGSSIPTNWGLTIGGKSTANSGNLIAIRITCPASWTGSISNISFTWVS